MCVFINSGVKSTHQAAVVSKIDSRLEQYTSAIEVRDVLRVVVFACAVPSAWDMDCTAFHLAPSKSSIRSGFKCHFLRIAFFAPIN